MAGGIIIDGKVLMDSELSPEERKLTLGGELIGTVLFREDTRGKPYTALSTRLGETRNFATRGEATAWVVKSLEQIDSENTR